MMRTLTVGTSRVMGVLAELASVGGTSPGDGSFAWPPEKRRLGLPADRSLAGSFHTEFLGHRGPDGKGLVTESIISGHSGPWRAGARIPESKAFVRSPDWPFPLTSGGTIDYVRSASRDGHGPAVILRRPAGRAACGRPALHSEARPDMFARLSRLVTRWPLLVVVAWIALAVGLRYTAPPWDQVTKDDNVRFFPGDFPSVIGQNLLEFLA